MLKHGYMGAFNVDSIDRGWGFTNSSSTSNELFGTEFRLTSSQW